MNTKLIPVRYDRHAVQHQQAERPAKARLHPPASIYQLYGADFIRHPWRLTGDYSRIRALSAAASVRYPSTAIEVVVSYPTVGDRVPLRKFMGGVEHRWSGR